MERWNNGNKEEEFVSENTHYSNIPFFHNSLFKGLE
jgi:hypothetical protein